MRRLLFLTTIIFILSLLFLGFNRSWRDRFSVEFIGHKSSLEEIVSRALEGSSGTYSVIIKNLRSGEEYYRDEDRIFDAGSLYKLGTMLTALQQIERGELDEEEIIEGNIEAINKVLGQTKEEAELKEGTIDFTIKEALSQMITISHNYAAVLLTEKVGTKNIQDSINTLGLKSTIIDTQNRPKTTGRDMLIFFEKVYKRNRVSAYVSNRMIDLMLSQELNDRIPKYLPRDAKVAHKTGEIDFLKHDAGIVFTPHGDYIIVVMSESDNPTAASERIANISKEVYDYFASKN